MADTATSRTPLHARHVALGARLVPFAGYELPVQYASIVAEHQAVRQAAGLFDVSHMGEFLVSGPGAAAFLARAVPGDVLGMDVGKAIYTQFCNAAGGVVDDLLIYRLADHYLLVVNASNIAKDWEHLQSLSPPADATLIDASEKTALLALQGPRAAALLQPLADMDLSALKAFRLAQGQVAGRDAIVARTGYTGEDGFEIVLSGDDAGAVWDALVAAGATPCGLGARDTLRLEAGLPLYGHEWDDATSPVAAGFGWTIKSGAEYLGKAALARQIRDGTPLKLVGLRLLGKAPAREGYEVLRDAHVIGRVASGAPSPTLGHPIATAFVPADVAVGDRLTVRIRTIEAPAEVVKLPFYRRSRS
ncbi:MAG: glycine cleavage system aminomethyltransferase GcvT [Candidatus Sericytochromatia bacterium]|nr:glycine cleavage system aminomethyltransferase GcvT [Candidatus Tanganyikabacteria bacterium]